MTDLKNVHMESQLYTLNMHRESVGMKVDTYVRTYVQPSAGGWVATNISAIEGS